MAEDTTTNSKPVAVNIGGVLALVVLAAVLSWTASQHVSEIAKIRMDNASLAARNAELVKELDKCSGRNGYRPTTPIGSPIGSPAGAVGSAPEPTPTNE